MQPVQGIHHVTAIASDPQRNLDFYVGVLGLRFVKRTVNFDDPHTYHFYFGDDVVRDPADGAGFLGGASATPRHAVRRPEETGGRRASDRVQGSRWSHAR